MVGRAVCCRLSSTVAWHPEWVGLLVAGLAWIVLLRDPSMLGHGAVHLPDSSIGGGRASSVLAPGAVPGYLGACAIMVAAMIPMVALAPVRHVGFNSLGGARRFRSIGIFLVIFLGTWTVLFGGVLAGASAFAEFTPSPVVLGLSALAVGAVWQGTPWRRRALSHCWRPVPLRPIGWRADVTCAQFALRQAGRCMVVCAPVMVSVALTRQTLLAMIATSGVLFLERQVPYRPRHVRLAGEALLMAAIGAAILV